MRPRHVGHDAHLFRHPREDRAPPRARGAGRAHPPPVVPQGGHRPAGRDHVEAGRMVSTVATESPRAPEKKSRRGPKRVIVVGGGIAGVAAALRLAEEGVRVTLLETRRKLGGRATSFTDVRTGEVLDNCQHVAMGCCKNYIDLCRRLGVERKIIWRKAIHWVETGGRTSAMRPGALPAPAHFAGSFLAARFLGWRDKTAIGRAMLAMRSTDRTAWRGRGFGEWLREHGQSESAVRDFWAPVIVSACNLDVERVCAEAALHVFQDGFLAGGRASWIGVSAAPLVELYDPAEMAIRLAGGELRLGVSVERLGPDWVETTGGERLEADRVISAVPFERVSRIVDEGARIADPRFEKLERIGHSPILGVHLWFDGPVMRLPAAALVSRPTQWLFRKDSAGARVHAVISAADEWMGLDEDQIAQRVIEDVRACLPESRAAKLVRSRAVKEKRATFALTPEVQPLRPAPTGPSGVILAGDYTQTGWPATMEGATISGYAAAEAAMEKSGMLQI
ncbi:MAG: FAD-dependent oxidoreductase [Phycisphaeraceae bacterium]|nr:MAG: FAD-dependent oxidoreductase [Phycisphaeraceae bacterium]